MLINTFVHLPGVGLKKERSLWAAGILNWDDFERAFLAQPSFLFSHESNSVQDALERSRRALSDGDLEFFAARLPKSEHYRIALASPETTAFLDVETTGLSHYYDEITVVGVGTQSEYRYFLKGYPNDEVAEILHAAKCIVTFNGTLFDLKFIRREYPNLRLPSAHIDLRYLVRRIGLSGGQKEIEERLGLKRHAFVEGLLGENAPILWHKYKMGDVRSAERLVAYNRADVGGMRAIFDVVLDQFLAANDIPHAIRPRPAFSSGMGSANGTPTTWQERLVVPEYRGSVGPKATYSIISADLKRSRLRIVGIDLTGSERRPTGWCLLEGNKATTTRVDTDEAIVAVTLEANPHLVSIDSPLSLPKGRTRVSDDDPARREFGITRECERILKRRGVNVYPCLINSMQALTARGIRLANAFRKRGIPVIESYPGAAQDIMSIPRKRQGLDHLKAGLRDFGIEGEFLDANVSHDEVDAVTSALVGLFFWSGRFEALGNDDEEYLIIPDLEKNPNSWRTRIVIGISGPISAGKTSAARVVRQSGFAYGRYSEIIADLVQHEKRTLTRENMQEMGLRVHREFGQRWLGKELVKRLSEHDRIVIDGMRFPEDRAFLAETFGPGFFHLHVSAPEELRRLRYVASGDNDVSFDDASRHDVENEVERLADLADELVLNDGSLEKLGDRIAAIMTALLN